MDTRIKNNPNYEEEIRIAYEVVDEALQDIILTIEKLMLDANKCRHRLDYLKERVGE